MTETPADECKRRWRRIVKDAFALTAPRSRDALDEALNARLAGTLAAVGNGILLGYAALPDEPNIGPSLSGWLSRSGALAMPAWLGGSDILLRRVRDLVRDLGPGRADIPEPRGGLPECRPETVETAVVPGRAFSETGVRLGRGAGCYDALLARRGVLKIGVAYDFQVFPALPATDADVRMDLIATPGRLIVVDGALRV